MLQMKLEPLGTAFAAVVPNAYHYFRPGVDAPFLVWAEEAENGLEADNLKDGQAIRGTTDYFTKTEFDSAVDDIQETLNDLGVSWYLNSVQFEEDTNLIHYEWIWEVA